MPTAEAKGFFAEEGLTVEMTAFEDGPTEIAAMESSKIDISYIGPGAHKLCSTGNAQVVLLQHLGDGDCIIGLKGLKTLEELKGKTVGYAAGHLFRNHFERGPGVRGPDPERRERHVHGRPLR